jgi:hypothetical protein
MTKLMKTAGLAGVLAAFLASTDLSSTRPNRRMVCARDKLW